MASQLFAHEPLPQGRWIRLLRLLPGKFTDPIACELIITEVDKAPAYEPISYCWGDANKRNQILCETLPFTITASLFQALRRFRLEVEHRIIWADGICIDQESIEERGNQVSFMDEIYSRGSRTLIWLGEAEDVKVNDAMKLIKEVNSYMDSEIKAMNKSDQQHIYDLLRQIKPPTEGHVSLVDPERWTNLSKLIKRPWFRRVWVLQEVGLSKAAIAFCGYGMIDFSQIALFSVYNYELKKLLEVCSTVNAGPVHGALLDIWLTFDVPDSWILDGGTLEGVRNYYKGLRSGGFERILHSGRDFEATQDVDRVFAFLGHPLARKADGKSKIVAIDYTKSLGEVSRDVAEHICLSTRSLLLLCYVQHWEQEEIDESLLPSWVPVWTRGHRYDSLIPHPRWDASLSKETADQMVIDISGGKLHVAAIVMGFITRVSSELPEDQADAWKIIEIWWDMYSKNQKLPQDDPQFWKGFLWGLISTYPHPTAIIGDFVAFCRQRCPQWFCEIIFNQTYFASSLEATDSTNSHRFSGRVTGDCSHKRLFVTDGGICGLGHRPTREGDVLAVLFGCPMPVVLRKTESPGEYRFVGQSYVRGYMFGQLIEEQQKESMQAEVQSITLT
jgi:hypothetical protein